MGKPKVLVGITTYKGKDYMMENCYKAVRAFNYPSDCYSVLIVDNTADGGRYARQLKRRGMRQVVHIDRGENSRVALARSQNYIRQHAIDGGYDYVLFVESDLLPDPDALLRLMLHAKPVVGSWYLIGHDVKLPCIFLNHHLGAFNGTRQVGIRLEDEGRKRLPNFQEAQDWWQSGLRECHGCGLGCTLVDIEIIKKYPFWTDPRFDNKHSDVYWYMNLTNDGYRIYVDTDVNIPHFPSKWDDVADR